VNLEQLQISDSDAVWVVASPLPVAELKFPLLTKVGAVAVVIHRTKLGFRAVDRACPHQGASWTQGELIMNESMIKCALHAFTFRLSDGKGVNCPGFRIKVFDVKETDGRLLVRVPSPSVVHGQ
jgi:nitrite reductase/ring-hydroxylating ferredoxin subunit